jgi:hypothetical protein
METQHPSQPARADAETAQLRDLLQIAGDTQPAHWGNTNYGALAGGGIACLLLCLGLAALCYGIAAIIAAAR